MKTTGIVYTRHIYNRLKGSKEPGQYELIKNTIERPILPLTVSIEPMTGNLSKEIKEWLCIRNCPNWEYKNPVTGLRPTTFKNVFEGYLINPAFEKPTPGSLIFFEFSRNRELLVIDIFKDYYTDNPFAFNLILGSHQFLLNKKARP